MIGADISAASYVTPADSGPAPTLPVEQHAVACALALEFARAHAVTALAMMQWAPRNTDVMFGALNDLVAAVNTASASYRNYSEVRACAGQA